MPIKRAKIRKSNAVKKSQARLQFEVERTIRNKEFIDLVKQGKKPRLDLKKNLFIFEVGGKAKAVNLQRLGDSLGPHAIINAFAFGAKKKGITWQNISKASGFKVAALEKAALEMKKKGIIDFKV